jgi:hypothetical protein
MDEKHEDSYGTKILEEEIYITCCVGAVALFCEGDFLGKVRLFYFTFDISYEIPNDFFWIDEEAMVDDFFEIIGDDIFVDDEEQYSEEEHE